MSGLRRRVRSHGRRGEPPPPPVDRWHRQKGGEEMYGFYFQFGVFFQGATSACWWHHSSLHGLPLPSSPSPPPLSLSLNVLIPNICTCWRCFLSSGDVLVPVFHRGCGGKCPAGLYTTSLCLPHPVPSAQAFCLVQYVFHKLYGFYCVCDTAGTAL